MKIKCRSSFFFDLTYLGLLIHYMAYWYTIMPLNNKNSSTTILKPFLTAGIIIIIFGGICIWIAEIIGLKEEGEGFRIIGWRFIVGGIISISLGYIFRYYKYIYGHFLYLWRRFGLKRKRSKYDDLYRP